ncbi:MAG: hypothetical protein EHM24_20000 [Acidobacteria bacterium]|nr:MAG: hypothetical protein EHM24_20000 [Acidobacteriota bacterium]
MTSRSLSPPLHAPTMAQPPQHIHAGRAPIDPAVRVARVRSAVAVAVLACADVVRDVRGDAEADALVAAAHSTSARGV